MAAELIRLWGEATVVVLLSGHEVPSNYLLSNWICAHRFLLMLTFIREASLCSGNFRDSELVKVLRIRDCCKLRKKWNIWSPPPRLKTIANNQKDLKDQKEFKPIRRGRMLRNADFQVRCGYWALELIAVNNLSWSVSANWVLALLRIQMPSRVDRRRDIFSLM